MADSPAIMVAVSNVTRTPRLLTVGHGTLGQAAFAQLLSTADIGLVVDVRRFPASRRHPHFARDRLEESLPAAGLAYRWDSRLGGFRRASVDSPNTALRHPSFRGYADYMATQPFRSALEELLRDCDAHETAVMCAETVWWRCHRRLIADAATLICGADVHHLGHDGRLTAHRLTDDARPDGRCGVIYAASDLDHG